MFRLAADQLQPGMVVARNVFSANGTLLLAHDVILDDNLIARLGNLKIDSVYVRHPLCDVEPVEIMHEKTRVETIRMTKKAFENFRGSQVIQVAGLQNIVRKIIEDAMGNHQALIHLTDIRTHDDYTFAHSINVCLISVMIGLKMRLKEQELFDLAMGAILHDLGKMLVPSAILNKPAALSPAEWEEMRVHADKGFEILRKQGAVSLVSAHVAYQHHENYDGSGYSRGLRGQDIHRYARIVAVADIYDAVTSDRPYRRAYLPHEAYEIIAASRGTKLDPKVTDVFLENVALYPVGSTVLLDTGEVGVVLNAHPKLQARPVVKVVVDAAGAPWVGPEKVIDLTRELTRFITKVFRPEEIFAVTAPAK